MTSTAAAIAEPTSNPPPQRGKVEVDPAAIIVDTEGFATRSLVVRLPFGAIADDLKEPGLWTRIQRSHVALRKFDRLLIVAFDESWIAECHVAHATSANAILGKPRITVLPERSENLLNDGNYQVVWAGNGYQVRRIRDGVAVSEILPNTALAERALVQMYPKPV